MVIRILFAFFILCGTAQAATYTVCSSGCTATTFAGLFAAIDLAPDDIVEAQADSPGGSKTFVETITPGSNDYGTAGHPLIIRARAGDTITIQGPGNTGYGSFSISHSGTNGYITFDGFTLTNYGYAGVRINGSSATSKVDGIVLKNLTVNTSVNATITDTTNCFFISNASNITLLNNTCNVNLTTTNQTDCFVFTDSNADINGNSCIDNNGNGDGHNDGFQTWQASAGTAYNGPYIIRNNTLVHKGGHSNALQLMYFENRVVGDNYIYNNIAYISYASGGAGSNLISVYNKNNGANGNFYFYNNTFMTNGPVTPFVSDTYSPNIVFKNNILYGGGAAQIIVQNTSNVPSNFENNLYYGPGAFVWGSTWTDFAGWKGFGLDNNYGINADPKFVSTASYPYNLSLQSSSPAINAGADLSSVFTTDILGNTRSGTYDIGAYEYGAIGVVTYYVDPAADGDAGAGTSQAANVAWKTIAKVNASSFNPGDFILFKKGGVWRGEQLTPPSSGTSGSPITFGSYGTGAKPKILGSKNLSATGDWTASTGSKWVTTATIAQDIGNLIFNNEGSVGVKKSSFVGCTSQGDFYYDPGTSLLYVYSVSNPATYYSGGIEAARHMAGAYNAKNYITFDGLDFRYQGGHGIQTSGSGGTRTGTIVQNCDLSYIGGSYLEGTVRYGNAIEFWDATVGSIVRYNRIDNVYDAALTSQGMTASTAKSNESFYYNVVSNSEYGFEFFQADGASQTTNGLYVYNNVFYNNGGGWGHAQRVDPNGTGFIAWDSLDGGQSNCFFINNIVNTSSNQHLRFDDPVNTLSPWVINYNSYYPDGAAAFLRSPTATNFASWKTASGKDANSIIANPLLSTATYRLGAGSPAINIGYDWGQTRDFEGTLKQGSNWDIGAYEYISGDPTLPSCTIQSPTDPYSTSSSTVNVSGIASDNVGVTSVTWVNDRGGLGTAMGTTTWSISNIALYSGVNVITVTAHDAAGNTTPRTVNVTYTPAVVDPPSSVRGVTLRGIIRR